MGTVTKSLRIDEEFISIIETYNKILNEVFGCSPTINNVLASTVVEGFKENLQVFRLCSSDNGHFEAEPGEVFNDSIKEKMKELLYNYDSYLAKREEQGGEK